MEAARQKAERDKTDPDQSLLFREAASTRRRITQNMNKEKTPGKKDVFTAKNAFERIAKAKKMQKALSKWNWKMLLAAERAFWQKRPAKP